MNTSISLIFACLKWECKVTEASLRWETPTPLQGCKEPALPGSFPKAYLIHRWPIINNCIHHNITNGFNFIFQIQISEISLGWSLKLLELEVINRLWHVSYFYSKGGFSPTLRGLSRLAADLLELQQRALRGGVKYWQKLLKFNLFKYQSPLSLIM